MKVKSDELIVTKCPYMGDKLEEEEKATNGLKPISDVDRYPDEGSDELSSEWDKDSVDILFCEYLLERAPASLRSSREFVDSLVALVSYGDPKRNWVLECSLAEIVSAKNLDINFIMVVRDFYTTELPGIFAEPTEFVSNTLKVLDQALDEMVSVRDTFLQSVLRALLKEGRQKSKSMIKAAITLSSIGCDKKVATLKQAKKLVGDDAFDALELINFLAD